MDDIDDAEMLAAGQAVEQRSQRQDPLPTRASNSSGAKVQQPTPQVLPKRSLPSSILVSPRQKGNPVLTHIAALPWEYTDTPADYVLGQTTCALYLSLKYHRLHPEYIYSRIRGLEGRYNLRVLLAVVDIDNHEEPLRELAKTSLVNNLTLMLAWSAREVARYLEAYRSLERADPSGIRGARAATFAEHMTEFVTTPRGVNKTDAVSLVGNFGSIRNAVNAEKDMIMSIPGWGEKKTDRLLATVNESFRVSRTRARKGRAGAGPEELSDDPLRKRTVAGTAEMESQDTSNALTDVTVEDAIAVSGRKRTIDDTLTRQPEEGEEDEASLFIAEKKAKSAASNVIIASNQGSESVNEDASIAQSKRSDEPLLSEGVKAALAKLRQQ